MDALSQIKSKGFSVSLVDGFIEINPASKLTDAQRHYLKSHKAEIIEELEREQAANDRHDRDPFDDRHFCHECRNLINGRCVVQRFRPVDDIPRRCGDYTEHTQHQLT